MKITPISQNNYNQSKSKSPNFEALMVKNVVKEFVNDSDRELKKVILKDNLGARMFKRFMRAINQKRMNDYIGLYLKTGDFVGLIPTTKGSKLEKTFGAAIGKNAVSISAEECRKLAKNSVEFLSL